MSIDTVETIIILIVATFFIVIGVQLIWINMPSARRSLKNRSNGGEAEIKCPPMGKRGCFDDK